MNVMEPATAVAPKPRGNWGAIIFSLIFLIVIGVILFFGYRSVASERITQNIPVVGTEVVFTEAGIGERFAFNGSTLAPVTKEERADGVVVQESKPLASGGQVVLATVPRVSGSVLGVIYEDGTFASLLADGTQKTDLSVQNSLAVFSVIARPVVWESPLESTPSDPALNEGESEGTAGHADGPVDLGIPFDTVSIPKNALFAVDVGMLKPVAIALGVGKSPRFQKNGTLVALAPEGIVRINPKTSTREKILSYLGADDAVGGISSDGSVAILSAGTSPVLDIFDITSSALHRGVVAPNVSFYGIAFTDDGRFFIRTGEKTVELYRLPNAEGAYAVPIAKMQITQ